MGLLKNTVSIPYHAMPCENAQQIWVLPDFCNSPISVCIEAVAAELWKMLWNRQISA